MSEYLKMESWGNLESTVNELLDYKNKGILVYTDFNGTILYSDTVTMDDAYLKITGKTKAEFDKAQQDWRDNYDGEEREFKAQIPKLAEEWKKKAREILTEDKWDYWDKIVPIRLGDLYHGFELGCCLDIVNILNNSGSLDEAKAEIEKQGHSGMSWSLVCSMINRFCERGKEFVDYVN